MRVVQLLETILQDLHKFSLSIVITINAIPYIKQNLLRILILYSDLKFFQLIRNNSFSIVLQFLVVFVYLYVKKCYRIHVIFLSHCR